MSRSDVFKSLLRSTALAAGEQLRKLPVREKLERFAADAAIGRTPVPDAALTAAVAHVHGVTAATVRSTRGRIGVDASFEDGGSLRVGLLPAELRIAPFGAKELAFDVEPPEGASDPRAADVAGAIAGVIAQAVWRAALGLERGAQAVSPAEAVGTFVTREPGRLIADLRSVPAVRRALSKRMALAVIEGIRPRSIDVGEGRLHVHIAFEALEALRR